MKTSLKVKFSITLLLINKYAHIVSNNYLDSKILIGFHFQHFLFFIRSRRNWNFEIHVTSEKFLIISITCAIITIISFYSTFSPNKCSTRRILTIVIWILIMLSLFYFILMFWPLLFNSLLVAWFDNDLWQGFVHVNENKKKKKKRYCYLRLNFPVSISLNEENLSNYIQHVI